MLTHGSGTGSNFWSPTGQPPGPTRAEGPWRCGSGAARIDGCVVLIGDTPDDAADVMADELRAVREAAAELRDAPIVVDARAGVGVIGPPVLSAAIARALALRVAARLSPVDAMLAAPPGEPWTEHLPHAVVTGDAARYAFREGDDDTDRHLVGGTRFRPRESAAPS